MKTSKKTWREDIEEDPSKKTSKSLHTKLPPLRSSCSARQHPYEQEEDTCMSYKEEDICLQRKAALI